MDERTDAIAASLDDISEQLAELALDRLGTAVRDGDDDAAAQERIITRARRAVEKAAGLLHGA